MATTLTRNLKLRVNSNLTADAKYNLERIDLLGSAFTVDTADTLQIRSRADITIEPQSADVEGSGEGGNVNVGTADHQVESFNVFADEVNLSGSMGLADQATGGNKSLQLRYKSDLDGAVDIAANRTLSFDVQGADRDVILGGDLKTDGGDLTLNLAGNLSLTIPANSAGYLQNDGAGSLSWVPISGAGDVLGEDATWLAGDGLTKVISHGLSSEDVEVAIFDENDEQILIDTIVTTDSNTLTLTASEAPSISWRVVLQAKP